jgi:hypothetical protein
MSLGVLVLSVLFGIDIVALLAVFPAAYVYLTFFNRMGLILLLFRRASWKIKRRMFWSVILVLPAIFFITRYGMIVAAGHVGFDMSAAGGNDALEGILKEWVAPGTIVSLMTNGFGKLLERQTPAQSPRM